MKEQFEKDLLCFKTNMVWGQLCAINSEEVVEAYLSHVEIKEWLFSGKTLNKAYKEAQRKIDLKGKTFIQTFSHDFQENTGLMVEVCEGLWQRANQRFARKGRLDEYEIFKNISSDFRKKVGSRKKLSGKTRRDISGPVCSNKITPRYFTVLPLPLWRRAIQISARFLFCILCLSVFVVGIYLFSMSMWLLFSL